MTFPNSTQKSLAYFLFEKKLLGKNKNKVFEVDKSLHVFTLVSTPKSIDSVDVTFTQILLINHQWIVLLV